MKQNTQPTEKKKVNDQGTFTKFPNIIFDECDLPESAQVIFMRLCRHVCHKNNVFIGSIRKLSNLVRISKSTVERMLPRLEEAHYIKKEWDEERKQMIIHVLMAPLWEQNKSRTEPTPDLGPHNSIIVPKWDIREINYLNYDAFVPEWDDLMEAVNNPVPKRDKFVPKWDRSGSNWDKSVPPSSSNVGTTTITTITTETTRENAHVSHDNAPTPSSSNSSPSITESVASETPSQPLTDTTAPLTVEPAPSEPALPEFTSQREEKATGQGNEQSTKQAVSDSQENKGQDASGKTTRRTTKRSSKKDAVDLDAIVPTPPPAAPASDMPWNARKAILWADHFRGFAYPESTQPKSKYCRVRDAVILIVQRGIPEEQYVYMFRFMKGLLPNGLKSDYWSEHEVDAWTVNDHWEDQVKEIKRKSGSLRQATQAVAAFAEAGVKPGMRMENGKLVIDSNKTVSGLNYFNIPSKPTEQRGA